MQLKPFYHSKEKEELINTKMTDAEETQKSYDLQDFKVMRDYRKDCGWEKQALRGIKIYNVVQTAQPTDEVSRIFIGYTRTQIDKGIEQMSSGEPDFDFELIKNTDKKQHHIWRELMAKMLSDCHYRVQQDLFFRDYFTMGCGVFEVYTDYPQRTIRIPNADGTFTEKVIRDRRKPRVGVRALNPFACWRNPNIGDTTDVPSCVKRRVLTYDQFIQEFGRSFDQKGKPRYKNLDKVKKSPYVIIYNYQNELTDSYRLYALPTGDEFGLPATITDDDLGIMIYDTPLKIHNIKLNNLIERSCGVNIQGTCTMRWGTFFDVYDASNATYSGNHSVYGVGLPKRIEGEDMILQTLFNQHLDNERWASSYALNYKGNNADSYIDIDANRLYGGEFIDGEITPMPLGYSRPQSFEAMKNTLDTFVIPATGINHQQIVGDTSKTAFEFAQRIKQANASAEQRLMRLENELFSQIGNMLFAASLTELTVEEWEDITAEEYKRELKNKENAIDDYKMVNTPNGKKYQKRTHEYVKIPKLGMIERFDGKDRKRKINPNAIDGSSLVIDPELIGQDTFIPIVREYVYPIGMIENDILPRVIVDSKRMLKDKKAQSAQEFNSMLSILFQLQQLGWSNLDLEKVATIVLDFGGQSEQNLLKDAVDGSDEADRKKLLEQMSSLINPNNNASIQLPQQTDTGAVAPNVGAQGPNQNSFEQLAAGTL